MPNLHSSKWHLSAAAARSNLFTAANGRELNKARAEEEPLQMIWKTLTQERLFCNRAAFSRKYYDGWEPLNVYGVVCWLYGARKAVLLFIELIYTPRKRRRKAKEHGSFCMQDWRAWKREKGGVFSFLTAVLSALCPDTTAEEVIILFLSLMHIHQSRNASEKKKINGLWEL